MNVLDVNILVALFRPSHPHHDRARAWWDRSTREDQSFTVPDLVWVGFLRLVTHPRVFERPATSAEAWAFLDAVVAQPGYLVFAPDARVIGRLRTLTEQATVVADLVTDAYIAACALSLGAAVVSFDRDFRRFDGLRVVEPS